MTRKDYIAFAAVLRMAHQTLALNSGQKTLLEWVTLQLCELFKRDNERFNNVRFLNAAGMSDLAEVQCGTKETLS